MSGHFDPLLPDGLVLTAEHCGKPLTWRGSGVRWQGIEEHSERRLRCENCGLQMVVSVVDLDPLPSDDARRTT